jgi:arylsulfatase A-like enzyme
VAKADQLIGKIVEAVKEAEIGDKTMIIVSADHGGKETSHGGESLGEVEIPIILSGAGIKQGFEIQDPINIYDIASTAAFVFGLEQPKAWIGRPIKEAFQEEK